MMDTEIKAHVKELKDDLQHSQTEVEIIKSLTLVNVALNRRGTGKTCNKISKFGYSEEKLKNLHSQLSECHVKQILEILLKKFSLDWIQTIGADRFKTLVKPILLDGNLKLSFITLFQATTSEKRKDLTFEQCVLVLEEFLTRQRLAKLLLTQTSVTASCSQQQVQVLNAEQQMLVDSITSLPSKMANQLRYENSEHFLPRSYVPLLALAIFDSLGEAYQALRRGENVSLHFISVLIGKLCSVGYADLLFETLLLQLCVKVRTDFIWCRICERIFSCLPPRCMEAAIVPLIKEISWYGLVDKFLGDAVIHNTHLKMLLCTKLMLHRMFPNPKQILHNIIGYLSTFHTRRHLLLEVSLTLLKVWGDASSLRHISFEHHVYISRALMVCLGHLNDAEKSHNESEFLRLLMPGVQTHLESSDPSIRTLGMVVAKTITQTVAPSGPKLEFEIDSNDPNVKDLLSYKDLPVDPGISDAEKTMRQESSNEVKEKLSSLSVKEKDRNQREEADSDLDSDDDLEPYDMSNDTSVTKVKDPKFVRDCMEGLICSSDDPDRTEACLSAAEALIRRKTDGLEEIAVEFAKILLHLQDTHSFSKFQDNRFNSLVALTAMCPAQVAEYLTKEFYERNYSTRQRMDILETLAKAAQELSCVESKEEQNETIPAHTDSPSLLSSDPSQWRNVIQKRIESNTRRFTRGRTQPEPVPVLNRFAPFAGKFFYPLMYRVDKSDPCLDLLGKDSLLLFRLLYTLAVILNSSKNILATPHMGKALLEFTWPIRLQKDCCVRQAVLVCTTTVFLVVPAHALLSELHSDISETKAWLEDTIEQDPDTECQKLAAQALFFLQNNLKKEMESSVRSL